MTKAEFSVTTTTVLSSCPTAIEVVLRVDEPTLNSLRGRPAAAKWSVRRICWRRRKTCWP
jgi:hypothetical protein